MVLCRLHFTAALTAILTLIASCSGGEQIEEQTEFFNTHELSFGDNDDITQLSSLVIRNERFSVLTWDAEWDSSVGWLLGVYDDNGTPNHGAVSFGRSSAITVKIDRSMLKAGENSTNLVFYLNRGDDSSVPSATVLVSAIGKDRSVGSVNMIGAEDIHDTFATLSGKIISTGASDYRSRGFVISKSHIPESEDRSLRHEAAVKDDSPDFSLTVSSLEKGTTYYCRAFIANNEGTAYSTNEISFMTVSSETIVETLPATDISEAEGLATLNAAISAEGSPEYTEKGFFYGKDDTPLLTGKKVIVNGSGAGPFSYRCAGLERKTTYYYLSYAIQNGNMKYGTVLHFKTDEMKRDVAVQTLVASGISSSSATLNGKITDEGNPCYTEKGFCYSSTTPTPSLSNATVTVPGQAVGDFSAEVRGLIPSTKYYFRVYAIQNGNPVYGEVESFETTFTPGQVIISQPSDITFDSVSLHATVTRTGDPGYDKRGFCFSTLANPRIEYGDSYIEESATEGGSFSMVCTQMNGSTSSSTTYYVSAFIKQGDSIIYSDDVSFVLGKRPLIEVLAELAGAQCVIDGSSIMWNGSFIGGMAADIPYQNFGFVYSEAADPVVGKSGCINLAYSQTIIDNGTRGFSADATLKNAVRYYLKAYAVTQFGLVYSEQVEVLQKVTEPVLGINTPQNVSQQADLSFNATLVGFVYADGNPPLLDWGFVYGTSDNPLIGDGRSSYVTHANHQKVDNTDYYIFWSNIYGLSPGVTYCVRAYGKTVAGYTYTSSITFRTTD